MLSLIPKPNLQPAELKLLRSYSDTSIGAIREASERGESTTATLALLAAIVGCGGEQPPEAGPARKVTTPNPCAQYRQAVEDAGRTQGDTEAEVVNSCGCSFSIRTSADKAAALRDTYPEWKRARCEVNCDTPCPAMGR